MHRHECAGFHLQPISIGDHLNSISITYDTATSTANPNQQYLPWGSLRSGSTNLLPTDYTYTGQKHDSSTGLMYYGARWYDSNLNRWIQPDGIIPNPGNPQDLDRYVYSRNNPLHYSDPSGHSPWDVIGQFFTGMAMEFTRTSNWMGVTISPGVAESLSPSSSESASMLVGRVVGDALTVTLGVGEVSTGISIGTGGATVGCGATLCLAAAPAIAAGVSVAGIGIETALSGASGFGENIGALFSKKEDSGTGKTYGSGSGQTKTIKGYDVRIDWESPGSNGNVHITINGEKIYITDPEDLSSLPKGLQNNDWVKQQIDRAYNQMTKYESTSKK